MLFLGVPVWKCLARFYRGKSRINRAKLARNNVRALGMLWRFITTTPSTTYSFTGQSRDHFEKNYLSRQASDDALCVNRYEHVETKQDQEVFYPLKLLHAMISRSNVVILLSLSISCSSLLIRNLTRTPTFSRLLSKTHSRARSELTILC